MLGLGPSPLEGPVCELESCWVPMAEEVSIPFPSPVPGAGVRPERWSWVSMGAPAFAALRTYSRPLSPLLCFMHLKTMQSLGLPEP